MAEAERTHDRMTEQTASFSLPGYTELQRMARGGFSSVYRSTQIQYSRPVAVKVLDVGLDDERSRRQYQRECDATGRLSGHPNIVHVLDSGFTPTGKPYLVMDLCANGTMGDRLAHDGPLPVADVLRTGVKIAGALETAHQAGILHRDLKPANILITSYGEPALSDFGIAAVTSHLEASVTMSAMTPNHAPPEVLEGARPTPSSDIYSLASTLYTLLAGRPPFAQESGHSILAFITRVLTAEVPPIPRPDIPPALSQALVTGLAKDPADRQPSAALLGYALQQIQVSMGMPYTEMVTRYASTAAAAPIVAGDPSTATGSAAPVGGDRSQVGAAAAPPLAGSPSSPTAGAAGAAPTVAPPAAPAPSDPPTSGVGAPVGDATILRPGATPAPVVAGASGGAASDPAPSPMAVAPPSPDLAARATPDGEMTMAVDRHAPVIERIEVEAPPATRSRTPLVVAVLVLVLVLLGGGAYLVLGRSGDGVAAPADPTAASSTVAPVTTGSPDPTADDGSGPVVPSTAGGTPSTGGVTTTSSGDAATGEPPSAVAARTNDAGGQTVIDVSWGNPGGSRLPVLYQLLGADGAPLGKISTLAGGSSSVIVTDADTGPLVADQTYCVAVGFITTSAKAVWAPAACTDGTTVDVAR